MMYVPVTLLGEPSGREVTWDKLEVLPPSFMSKP